MFDKLKSLFIADDEEFKRKASGEPTPDPATESEAKVENTPIEAPAPIESAPIQDQTSNNPTKGAVSEKFMNILLGALQKSNQPDFDYLEFRNSLKSLQKMDMDEATRYKSAFAMAQTMKVDAPKLINSAQFYLKILSNEEQKFGQALVNQRDRQIGEKQNQIKSISQSIRSKAEQIKKLSAEIEADQAKLKKLEVDLQGASGKVEQTKLDFIASYQAIVGQIQGDVVKMKQYLK